MAQTVEQEIAKFIQAAGDARICVYCDVAALTWLAYDSVLTLNQERRLIWRQPASLQKFLYFVLRYFSLLSLGFIVAVDSNYQVKYYRSVCIGVTWFKAVVALLVPTFIAEGLIMMRIYALYSRSRGIRAFLVPLYVVRVAVAIFCCIRETSSVRVQTAAEAFPLRVPVPGCVANVPPTVTWPNIIVTTTNLSVAVILLALTVRKPLVSEDAFYLRSARTAHGRPSFMHLFVRDGAIYILLVLASEVVFITFMFGFRDRLLSLAGYPWVIVIYVIAATRIALNLRASVAPPADASLDIDTPASDSHELTPRAHSHAGHAPGLGKGYGHNHGHGHGHGKAGQPVIFAVPRWAEDAGVECEPLAWGAGAGHERRSSAILE